MKIIIDTDVLNNVVKEKIDLLNGLDAKFDLIANNEVLKHCERQDMLMDILKEQRFNMGYCRALLDLIK